MVVDSRQQDRQVPQDPLAQMVTLERLESLEILDKMLLRPHHHLKLSHVKHANSHKTAVQALRDHQGLQEALERVDLQVKEENQGLKVHLDRLDLMDIPESLASLESLEPPDHLAKEHLSKDLLAHPERTVNLGWKVTQEYLEKLESLEDKDQQAIKDLMDHLETLEVQAVLVKQEIMDLKVDVTIVRHREQPLDIDRRNKTAIKLQVNEQYYYIIMFKI